MNPILARVRLVLRETGLTQPQLQERGVASQQLLSKWATNDEAEPSASSLAKVAAKLNVNGHWLLTGQGDKWTMEQGGDAVRAAGVLEGLALAEATIHKLRSATSQDEDAAVRDRAVRDHQVARTV